MKQTPRVFTVEEIKRYGSQTSTINNKGEVYWILPRPYSIPSLTTRFKLAYKVFIGEYDALKWL
jgi:hypothetical protein